MDALNIAVGLMSLVLGGFSIWLAIHFYERAKESETQTALALEAIRVQSDSLQRLTGRWMDRLTKYATEPRPADQGLMTLVATVADLPTTILSSLRLNPSIETAQVEPLRTELIDCYIALYYYASISNVALQALLPSPADYDETNDAHVGIRRIVDSTAADFAYMADVLGRIDAARLGTSGYTHLLTEARDSWRPLVRTTDQAFRSREGAPSSGSSPAAG